MLSRKIKKARLKTYSLISRFLPHTLVLIYHRVANLDSDPQKLSVKPENFDQHMEIISRRFQSISLPEMVDDLVDNGHIRDGAVVVTFDDGYEDNFLYARPILEKYRIPATIFVSSGYSGTNREFWWDELERLLLTKEILPDVIHIELNDGVHGWAVANDADTACLERQSRTGGAPNELLHASPFELYTELCARFQKLDSSQIDRALNELRRVTGDTGAARENYRPMNIEQLRSLYRGGLIEIGAHTRSHVNLAAQSAEQQSKEIQGSKTDLEEMLDGNVKSFAYPFGTLDHYSQWSIRCVRNAGFQNALANFGGSVSRLSNQYEIPRCMIRDWDGNTFEKAMDCYYSGQRQFVEPGG